MPKRHDTTSDLPSQEEFRAARKARRKDRTAPIVFVEVDALAPTHSRLINPKVKARPSTRTLSTVG